MTRRSNRNPGIEFHEKILRRIVLEPNGWSGGTDYSLFKHDKCAFSFTQAYGRPNARHVCWCVNPVRSHFILDKVNDEPDRKSRYLLKIVATWRDWHKPVQPVRITVNGSIVYDGPFFLENIVVGWPAQYFTLPPPILKRGRNYIEITSGSGVENTFLLAGVEILRRPDEVDFTVHSSPEATAVSEEFWVELHLLGEHPDIHVRPERGKIELLRREGSIFRFRATGPGRNIRIRFCSGAKSCEAMINRIAPTRQAGRVPVLIGMDGDDLRHDSTGEMERALELFVHSRVGDYMGFRPALGRNFCEQLRPDVERWRQWVRFCREHGVSMHYTGSRQDLRGLDIAGEAGDRFSGYQFHEPYLVFSPLVAHLFATEKLAAAKDPVEKREAFLDYLRGRVQKERAGKTAVYSGEPSLTCIYTAASGVDGILCEPVSNTSLLYGAARGTGKKFGAHIPADWYYGYPHDDATLRRVHLAAWLAYTYGGRIIYVESSLFKTNAFDRNDWEDRYCRGVRGILRDLYHFAQTDERTGTPLVPLAFVYGNLESMFWMDDDRIPEVFDTENWDRLHWGMPGKVEHRRLWNASEAWLPRVPLDDPRNESLTRMFTGTPYGPVDVVTPTADLSRYRAVAFLGWNTMTEEIYSNLLSFVKAGGLLFLCGCHLDTRIDPAGTPSMVFVGRVSELIGAEISGPDREIVSGIRSCALKSVTASRIDEHFLLHQHGGGKVYFGNFFDYPADPVLIERIIDLLRIVGKDTCAASQLKITTGSPYIHYNLWNDQGNIKIYALDADWRKTRGDPGTVLTVKNGNKTRRLEIEPGQLSVATIRS